MLRFAALNENDSGEEEEDQEDEHTTTKEAEEAEAFTIYNRALGLQRAGDGEGAEQLFSSLLHHPFILKARKIIEAEQEDSHHPALPLLYLVHKNMATSAVAKGNHVEAMKSYLEAVKIDSSEVTVWYKMGTLARQIHNYPLAKLAFEQGLQCNERHWPSLDAVITVLYALNDYAMCLEYCGRALERDPYYTKGLVFSRQILKEQPSLIADSKELFAYCDPIIHTVTVEPEEAERMIKECIDIRDKRRELAKKPELPPLKLPKPITQLTWRCVGECLVELFDDFTTSDPPKSLVLPVDMKEYIAMAEGRADHPEDPAPSCTSTTSPSTTASLPSSVTTAVAAIPTTTTNTSTTSGTTPAVVTSQADNSSPQNRLTEPTVVADSAQPVSSTSVDPHGVSGAIRDPASAPQGEQPMEVDERGTVPSGDGRSGTTQTGDKGTMEVAESCGGEPASGEVTVGDVNVPETMKRDGKDGEDKAEGKSKAGEEQGTGSKPAETVESVSLTGDKESSHAGNVSVPASSSLAQEKQSTAGVGAKYSAPSYSTAVTQSASHTHKVSEVVSEKSSPTSGTSERSSNGGVGTAEVSPKEVSALGVVKSSGSVSSESVTSVTSSSGSGSVAATSSLPTSITSRTFGSAAVVSVAESVRPVGEGKQPPAVSSMTDGRGVEGMEKKQVPVSQQLSVDVELAARTTAVFTSSPSVTQPPVTVTAATVTGASAVGVSSSGGGVAPVSVAVSATTSRLSPVTSATTHPHASASTSSSTTATPSSHAGLGRPSSSSPSLPKFQFNTITPMEVQALLQDCDASTPLLSTPAPSSYSSSLVQRFKQTAAMSSASATAAATAVSNSVASGPSMSTTSVSAAVGVSVEGSGEREKTTALSPSKKKESAAVTPVSAEVALQDHMGLGRGSKSSRRGTKRKRAPVEKQIGPEDYGVKRRSARVRNTRKEEETVDFQKLLHNFLPPSLTRQPVQEEEESQAEETVPPSQAPVDITASELCGGAPLEETEREEVRTYLKECVKRQGVVGLMYKYLVHLSAKDNRLWPAGVAELYLKVYERVRDHLTFPSLYCMDFPEICYTELSKMALVWSELVLDGFLVKRANTVVSPVAAQRQGGEAGPSDSGLFTDPHAEEDLLFLTGMVESGLVDLLGDQQTQFTIRVYWMKGRLALAENQMDTALETLDWVGDYFREESGVTKLFLPNCQVDRTISLEDVKRQQESLKRCQSLEESQRLFDGGQYQQVIDSLTATCLVPHATHRVFKPALPERHTQLELLQDALYQQEDWGRCLLWGEVVMDEALHHYRRAPTVATRDSWALTLVHLLEGLQRVLDREANAMQLLPMRSLVRLTQNLIRVIEVNHDVSEAVTEMPIASVLPWMLLYKIIRQEEDKMDPVKVTEEDEDGGSPASPATTTPSSLMLLSAAHEYLGRNAWCTRECGIFLQFCMDVLATELPKAHNSARDDLETTFEQCVYCLYSHPNKKGRARHLVDHNAPCIDLMWEHCEAVFEYFKPKTLPEFDSYKTSTVSGELHNLLRRIYILIPDTDDLSYRVNQVNNFIEGNSSTAPNFSSSCIIMTELYYLLADYYFKNKEQTKAIKFYTYDVCFNSARFDSWAGLALAKMYQLEQKLNSMELKIDSPVHKKSIQALRCFSRAVEIDEGVRKLWIEYGSLAYQLHSHASRQLRMKLWFPLTPELLDIAMETRVEMLATARNCYWKASKCEAEGSEEEWLHHYMMGKVMEKQRAHPRLYLEHYKQAAIYLHEEEAKYPRKILYNFTSPHLSLEALEMYYRLHVAVMKHLLRVSSPETKDDMVLFDRYLTEATESPFALRKEKYYDAQESVSSADDSQCSVISIPPYSTAHQKPVYHMTPQDHNYSKQKSSGGETSDASCEVKETGTETDGSQSSEETDGVLKEACPTSSEVDTDTGEKRGVSSEGEGAEQSGRQRQQQQENWQVDMVELHAETDSQVSDQLPDTKPLFFDKQLSGGFTPHLDKYPSLVCTPSTPSPSTPATTTTTTTSTTCPTPTDVTPSRQAPKTNGVKAAEKLADEKPILLIDKAKYPVETESGGNQGERKDQTYTETSDVLTKPASDSKTPVEHAKEAPQKAEQQNLGTKRESVDVAKDTNASQSSQSSVIVISSAEELSQDESLVSSMPSSSISAVKSADEQLPSQPSPQKRPSEESEQPSKRVKLDVGETGEKSHENPAVPQVGTKEERDQGVSKKTPAEKTETEISPQRSSAMTSVMEVDEGEGTDTKQAAKPQMPSAGSAPTSHQASDTQQSVDSVQRKVDVPENPNDTPAVMEIMDTSDSVPRSSGAGEGIKEGDVEMKEPDSSPLGRKDGGDTFPKQANQSVQRVEKQAVTTPRSSAPGAQTSTDHPSTSNRDRPEQSVTPSGQPHQEKDGAKEQRGPVSPVQGKGKAPSPSAGSGPSASEQVEAVTAESDQKDCPASQSVPVKQETEMVVSSSASQEKDKPTVAKLPEQKPAIRVQENSSAAAINVPEQKPAATANSSEEKTALTIKTEEVTINPSEEKTSAANGEQKTSSTTDPPKQKATNATEQRTSAPASEQKTPTEQPQEKTSKEAPDQTTPSPADPKTSSAKSSEQQSSTAPQAERRDSSSGNVQNQQRSSTDTAPLPTVLEEEEYRGWKRRLLDKCVEGLHVCLSRFPTHYKSLYRLAYLYYASDTHRNLEWARDLLLGNSSYPSLPHMPANGLFSDRKTNNFFNGMWKIPIDEIDRSGSFASHVNRSVQLLLEVLRDLGDVQTLLQVQSQLKKKPLDQGRKYLRDGERHILAQMAHSYTLDAVAQQLRRPLSDVDNTEVLLSAFKAYNSHRYGAEAQRAMMLLIGAFQRLGLPKHGCGTPLEQAMQHCNKLIASQALAQKAERARLMSQSSASMFPASSHPTTPHTMDSGTTPLPLQPPPGRPLTPGMGPHGAQFMSAIRGQSAAPNPLHHHSSHPSMQTPSSRPAYTPTSRPRTMSGSRGDMHSMYDPSMAMSRQHSTSTALDLCPPSQKSSTGARQQTSAAHKTSTGSQSMEVIDLTSSSPEKSREPAQMGSPNRMGGGAGWNPSMSAGRSPQDPSGRGRLPAGGVQGSPGMGQPRAGPSAGNARAGIPSAALFAQGTPPRPSASPFSSPHPFSSTPSTPTTPRPPTSTADEVSDLDLISDPEEELAFTSPDKLTSDVRHHFHGNNVL